jgi:membrane protein DedA with SNARE-associated domain
LLLRYPKWRGGVETALDLLRRYDTWFILSFRFIYGVRNVASFAMGTSGVRPLRFAALNFIAAFIWALSFAGFGYVFGQALERLIGDIILAFGVTMLTMFALVFIGAYVARRRQARRATQAAVTASPAERGAA